MASKSNRRNLVHLIAKKKKMSYRATYYKFFKTQHQNRALRPRNSGRLEEHRPPKEMKALVVFEPILEDGKAGKSSINAAAKLVAACKLGPVINEAMMDEMTSNGLQSLFAEKELDVIRCDHRKMLKADPERVRRAVSAFVRVLNEKK